MVRFGDERPIREVVHVRMLADKRDVDLHEHVQPPWGVVPGHRQRDGGLINSALEPGPGNGGKERPLVSEMNVGCLMTHPECLSNKPETQPLRRLVSQQSQRRLHQALIKPFVVGLNVFVHAHLAQPYYIERY